MNEMYHYVECGLQNVWLVNGFEYRDTVYGSGVSIHDVDGLHKEITKCIAQRPNLTGEEFRFLRKQLCWSQRTAGSMLGVSEQSISLWERGRNKIDKPAETLLKVLSMESVEPKHVAVKEFLERIASLDCLEDSKLELVEEEGEWLEAA